MSPGLWVIGIAIGLTPAAGPPSTGPTAVSTATAPSGQVSPPDDSQVRHMVRQLNHPSPVRRRAALRQLAAWGPFAFNELRRAAEGPDHEAALSAQALLAEFQAAILIGGQVRLEVDRSRIAWDEPFTLTVRVKNPTPVPIRVPWPQSIPPATQPVPDPADQVGRILDVADWLTVTDPDGRPTELRFEPIDGDAAVYEAVNVRAGKCPPFSEVPASGEVDLRVVQFNRGWARYPMLSAGTWHISFAYQPAWKDASWIEAGYGRVQAGPVSVEVVRNAPDAVRHATRPLQLALVSDDKVIRAEVLSTWDRSLHLNLNYGPDPTRYASVAWEFRSVGTIDWQRWEPEPESSQSAVRPDRIRRINPGESVEIARLARTELLKKAAADPPAGSCEAMLRYMNLPNARRLRESVSAAEESMTLSSPLFTGVLLSEPIQLDSP